MDPNETGGILLGHILDNGIWVVMEVLPPGWRSIFRYAYFEYDEQFVNYVAQNEANKYEQELSLLGLWHRHPGSMDTFSETDDGTNRTFARLNSQGAISGLVNIDPRFRLTMYHVSIPLHYEKVDMEVGNDLIPEEYFKLKHYPQKGLNPEPPEKKNRRTSIVKEYSTDLEMKYDNGNKNGMFRYLDPKYLFLLFFLVGAVMSLFLLYSYNELKNTADIKSLYKTIYSEYPPVLLTDSIKIEAVKKFEEQKDKIREQLKYKDILFEQNKVNCDEFIASQSKSGFSVEELIQHFQDTLFFKDDVKFNTFTNDFLTKHSISEKDANIDSLKKAYESPLIDNELAVRKQKFIDEDMNRFLNTKKNFYKNLSIKDADTKVKFAIILLLITTALSLIIVFVSRENKRIKEWLIIVASFVLSIIIGYVLSYKLGLVNPGSLSYFVGITAVFTIICFIIFAVERFLASFRFQPLKRTEFWFQQNPELYLEEENEIKKRFVDAEKNVENGIVSFFINTYKKVNRGQESLSVQLVYSSDYLVNREIKVYLISPDLNDLLGDRIVDFPYIAIDGAGESYLDLSKTIPKNKVSGIEVIRKLYEWLQQYDKWKANNINIKNIKL
jgi:hypothetical protein